MVKAVSQHSCQRAPHRQRSISFVRGNRRPKEKRSDGRLPKTYNIAMDPHEDFDVTTLVG